MKKILGVSLLAVLAVSALSSCKKIYSCECSYTYAGGTYTTTTLITDTKKKAETRCSDLATTGETCVIAN